MATFTDLQIGVHAEALQLRSRRMELLATNLANSDTPDYKARDIDFKAALSSALGDRTSMAITHARHFPPQGAADVEPLYRIPTQPSLDGNTVEPTLEHAAFSENTIRYQASLDFLNGKISSLRKALRGE